MFIHLKPFSVLIDFILCNFSLYFLSSLVTLCIRILFYILVFVALLFVTLDHSRGRLELFLLFLQTMALCYVCCDHIL